MESTKRSIILFFLVLFVAPVYSQEWVKVNCVFNTEDGDITVDGDVVTDFREGTALVVSARLKQSYGQGTMQTTRINRLHKVDLFTQREETFFPKDWNFDEGISCFGDSKNELFFQTDLDVRGTFSKSYKIFLWDSTFTSKSVGLPVEMAGNKGEGSFDNMNPTYDAVEKLLIFSSNRAGGLGGHDLYGCYRLEKGWGPVFNLGPGVNTSDNELGATLFQGTLYFSRMNLQDLKMKMYSASQKEAFQTSTKLLPPFNNERGDIWKIVFVSNVEAYVSREHQIDHLILPKKNKQVQFRLKEGTRVLSNIGLSVVSVGSGERSELKSNTEGLTALFSLSLETKYKVSIQEKDWELLKATGNGKGYKAELIDEFGNIIRVFKFDANGNFQFELLDFVYTNLTFLEEIDRSRLGSYTVESSNSISTKKYFFPVNESSLNEMQKIDLRNWLKDQSNSTITISGYASSDGSSKRNKELANARIQATKMVLLAQGVLEKNIKVKVIGINEFGEKGRRVELEAIPLSSQ
jgi:outer membrane protein OmpA-like peptidoglycan-associated protein